MLMSTNINVSALEASDYTQNPFGLVYRDAITANRPGEVNIHPVTYKLNGNEDSRQCLYPGKL